MFSGIDVDVELSLTRPHHGIHCSLDNIEASTSSSTSARLNHHYSDLEPKSGPVHSKVARPDPTSSMHFRASVDKHSLNASPQRSSAQSASNLHHTCYQLDREAAPLPTSLYWSHYDTTVSGHVGIANPDYETMTFMDEFKSYHPGSDPVSSLGKLSRPFAHVLIVVELCSS